MNCQSLFTGKNRKNIVNMSSAELAQCGKGYNIVVFFKLLFFVVLSKIFFCIIQKIIGPLCFVYCFFSDETIRQICCKFNVSLNQSCFNSVIKG